MTAESAKVAVGAAAGIEQGGGALVTVAFLGFIVGSFRLPHDLPGIVDGISCAVVPPKGAEIAVGATAGIKQGGMAVVAVAFLRLVVGSFGLPQDLPGSVARLSCADVPPKGSAIAV